MSGLTVGDLINALQKFPRDWHVCLGIDEECVGIKGILECSEGDYFSGLQYSFVEIQPIEELDLYDLDNGKLEMYGDREWYNTKDTFESVYGDLSRVKYRLNKKGEIEILECKNVEGEDISPGDINDVDSDDDFLNNYLDGFELPFMDQVRNSQK